MKISNKKHILIDSSSAILLFQATCFNYLIQLYRVVVTPGVFSEITVPGYIGSRNFHDLIIKGDISVSDPCEINISESGLGPGEQETIARFGFGDIEFILMDDLQGVKLCLSRKIPVVNALLISKVLFESKFICYGEYHRIFKKLCEIGRYSQKVIDFVEDAGFEEIRFFCP